MQASKRSSGLHRPDTVTRNYWFSCFYHSSKMSYMCRMLLQSHMWKWFITHEVVFPKHEDFASKVGQHVTVGTVKNKCLYKSRSTHGLFLQADRFRSVDELSERWLCLNPDLELFPKLVFLSVVVSVIFIFDPTQMLWLDEDNSTH